MERVKQYLNKIRLHIEERWKILLFIIVSFQLFIIGYDIFVNGIVIGDDTAGYVVPAKSFLTNGIMLDKKGNPILTRTPGYPLIIATLYKLFGENNISIIVSQVIMSVMITIMIFYVVSIYVNKTMGLVACILYISDYVELQYVTWIHTDLPFSFLVMLALFLLVKYVKGKKYYFYILTCIIINFAMLVRPNIMYFNMILAVVLAFISIMKKVKWKNALIYIAIFVVTFGGWSARNMYYYGEPMFTSIREESTYLFYAPLMYKTEYKCSNEEAAEYMKQRLYSKYSDFDNLPYFEQVKAYKDIGTEYIKEHFNYYIYINIKGLEQEMLEPDVHYIYLLPIPRVIKALARRYVIVTLMITYMLYVIGFFTNIKKMRWIDWLILLLSVYFMASTAVLGCSRFRLAFYPISVVGACISCRKTKTC